jgi:hypothetical protein
MLFSYSYLPDHKLEAMQSIVEYLFNEVWCKALDEEYGIHLFHGLPILHKVMEELNRRESAGLLNEKGTDTKFYFSVNKIFNKFESLERNDLLVYQKYFNDNNNIDALCANTAGFEPIHYSGLNSKYKGLNDELATFFTALYSSGFFGLAFVKDLIGADLTDYYKDFVHHNVKGTCPFCGLYPLDNEFDPTREAFDHYLPKAKYPFNSVNLRNLAPSCNKCNSGNKGEKDPLHKSNGERRKAFYPFSTIAPDLSLSISVINKNWSNLQPNDLLIHYQSQAHQEEIETWKSLFRIDDRYKAKLIGSGAADWLEQIRIMSEKLDLPPKDYISMLEDSVKNTLFSDCSFLKFAYLKAFENAGYYSQEVE